ncbi:MAG: GNAT family N-acetyltransferase [Steroidobacteraceae bacterium]
MKIRDATPADAALLHELILDLARYERLEDEVVGTAQDLARQLFCERPHVFALVAEFDGQAAGFALYFFNFSTFLARPGLYLEDLFVKPDYRSKGVGRALLAALAARAMARDCGRMEWAVLDWNEPAMAFYRGLGAQAVSEWQIFRMRRPAIERLANEAEPAAQ